MPITDLDPSAPATILPSRVDMELQALEERRAQLLNQKAREDAVRSEASRNIRIVAAALHERLCVTDHPTLACTWFTSPEADHPDMADWSEPQHQRWLAIAHLGISVQRENGWTVEEPA